MWLGLAHFHNGYSFLMISPNLLDIWPVFFLILSRYGTLHFLIVIRTSGDGYSLLGSKNSLPGTEAIIVVNSMNIKNIAEKSLETDLFKIIETLIFNAMNLNKSNESIHLELSTPTYGWHTQEIKVNRFFYPSFC